SPGLISYVVSSAETLVIGTKRLPSPSRPAIKPQPSPGKHDLTCSITSSRMPGASIRFGSRLLIRNSRKPAFSQRSFPDSEYCWDPAQPLRAAWRQFHQVEWRESKIPTS